MAPPSEQDAERAVVFEGPGRLQIRSFERPRPRAGEVLVRVRCCTLCGSDLRTWAGERPAPAPCVLGHETAGKVLETGGPVRPHGGGPPLAAGDRVVWSVAASCGLCARCRRGLPQKCDALFKYGHASLDRAGPFSGGMADLALLVPGTATLRIPAGVPDHVAAPAACAVATAFCSLRVCRDPAPGRVLVLGAGLLGLSVVAALNSRGATVIVSDPSPGRRAWALRFGASTVLDPLAGPVSACLRHDHGGPVDVAVEASGATGALAEALAALDIGGTCLLLGSVAPSPPWPVDPERIVRNLFTITGIHNYAPEDLAAALAFLAGAGGRFPFGEAVAATFPLEQAAAAIDAARDGGVLRVALAPGS